MLEGLSERQTPTFNREFKKLLRRQQRERRKTKGYNEKNKGFACALWILGHFSTVLGQTTTWNNQIQGFVEKVSKWR